MKNTNTSLDKKFKELGGQFDVEMPNVGHFDRFEARLKGVEKKKFNLWKPLAIAASLLLLISFAWPYLKAENTIDLKDVSPQMQETQSYFVSVIDQELKEIGNLETPKNKKIIDDALFQIKKLESDYKKLTIQLKESNEDKRIIYAMIDNYQKRIEILKSVLTQIHAIKQSKYNSNENTII